MKRPEIILYEGRLYSVLPKVIQKNFKGVLYQKVVDGESTANACTLTTRLFASNSVYGATSVSVKPSGRPEQEEMINSMRHHNAVTDSIRCIIIRILSKSEEIVNLDKGWSFVDRYFEGGYVKWVVNSIDTILGFYDGARNISMPAATANAKETAFNMIDTIMNVFSNTKFMSCQFGAVHEWSVLVHELIHELSGSSITPVTETEKVQIGTIFSERIDLSYLRGYEKDEELERQIRAVIGTAIKIDNDKSLKKGEWFDCCCCEFTVDHINHAISLAPFCTDEVTVQRYNDLTEVDNIIHAAKEDSTYSRDTVALLNIYSEQLGDVYDILITRYNMPSKEPQDEYCI